MSPHTSNPAQVMAQTLFSFCKEEVGKGGDYLTRIRMNRLYHEACGVIRNVDAIVKKAERDMALTVLGPQITLHYRELAEGYWQRRNFDIPLMPQHQSARAYEGLEMTRCFLKDTYPALYTAIMEGENSEGENWYRHQYARAIYEVEKARVDEWWSHNPITYTYGGK